MQCSQQFLLLQNSDSNIFILVARFTCIVVQRSQHFNAAFTQSSNSKPCQHVTCSRIKPAIASNQLLHRSSYCIRAANTQALNQPWAEKGLLTCCESFDARSPLSLSTTYVLLSQTVLPGPLSLSFSLCSVW